MQEILAYIVLILAVVFLWRNFFPKKKDTTTSCASNSCGCGDLKKVSHTQK